MTKFVYNNTKNANIGHIFFKLYYDYYLWVFFENKFNLHFKSFLAKILVNKLKKLMDICHQNKFYAQQT